MSTTLWFTHHSYKHSTIVIKIKCETIRWEIFTHDITFRHMAQSLLTSLCQRHISQKQKFAAICVICIVFLVSYSTLRINYATFLLNSSTKIHSSAVPDKSILLITLKNATILFCLVYENVYSSNGLQFIGSNDRCLVTLKYLQGLLLHFKSYCHALLQMPTWLIILS